MTKKLPPIHPGEVLREEFMVPLELSSNAVARAIDVTPSRVNDIVRERRGITADTALRRSEEHTSELQSLMRISYAVFCLKKNKHAQTRQQIHHAKYVHKLLVTFN